MSPSILKLHKTESQFGLKKKKGYLMPQYSFSRPGYKRLGLNLTSLAWEAAHKTQKQTPARICSKTQKGRTKYEA